MVPSGAESGERRVPNCQPSEASVVLGAHDVTQQGVDDWRAPFGVVEQRHLAPAILLHHDLLPFLTRQMLPALASYQPSASCRRVPGSQAQCLSARLIRFFRLA